MLWAKLRNISEFFLWKFSSYVVKFSVNFNRYVFLMVTLVRDITLRKLFSTLLKRGLQGDRSEKWSTRGPFSKEVYKGTVLKRGLQGDRSEKGSTRGSLFRRALMCRKVNRMLHVISLVYKMAENLPHLQATCKYLFRRGPSYGKETRKSQKLSPLSKTVGHLPSVLIHFNPLPYLSHLIIRWSVLNAGQ